MPIIQIIKNVFININKYFLKYIILIINKYPSFQTLRLQSRYLLVPLLFQAVIGNILLRLYNSPETCIQLRYVREHNIRPSNHLRLVLGSTPENINHAIK